MNDNIELPKLKTNEPIVIDDNDLSEVYVINSNKPMKTILVLSFLFLVLFITGFMFKYTNNEFEEDKNIVNIKSIEVISYNESLKTIDVAVEPSSIQSKCLLTETNNYQDEDFQQLSNEKCYVSIGFDKADIYFKNDKELVSEPLNVNNFVVDLKEKEIYYIPLNVEYKLGENKLVVGNPEIKWVSYDGILEIVDNVFKGIKVGKTTIKAMVDNQVIKEIQVVVTNTIVEMPKEFNSKKMFLGCEQFTYDEAKLLDEILESRIKEAGYGTRAGAVAAARFLTLEFPYRISYYWESGRLNNTGTHFVDGEGRYYHKGLYLDKTKYNDIVASLFGPAMWGCKLMSYENDPPNFVPGVKYPNGLDCSGFVTWSLFNGGFDVGDRGAGESPSKGQLTDLGEFRRLSYELINSGTIKVGDLFNFWGHISILIGEDEDNYYIAESLNTYKGVVVKKYAKNKVMNTFKYVVLMDSVYNGDGNLTNMWY